MIKNIALSLFSLLIVLSLFEFLVFKFFLLPAEIPLLQETRAGGLIKYAPRQSGTWRIQNNIEAKYQINDQGWNSGLTDYPVERSDQLLRIAIIGDSYIEALQVPFDSSLAELIQKRHPTLEVFRFGISGAPLSQYIRIYEAEVATYQPDMVIFNVVHNDFLESQLGTQDSLFSNSFYKWVLAEDGSFTTAPAQAYRRDWKSFLKQTNTYGYLVTRRQTSMESFRALLRFLSSKSKATKEIDFMANVPIQDLADPRIPQLANIFASEISRINSELRQTPKILILLDGPRGLNSEQCKTNALSPRLVPVRDALKRASAAQNYSFLDLSEPFRRAECERGAALKIPNDGHWTQDAHNLVAHLIWHNFLKNTVND